MGLRSRNAMGGRRDTAHGRATLPSQNRTSGRGISDQEFRGITQILEKSNPDRRYAARYLEREAMSDRQLRNFYNVATISTSNYDLNKMTRENSRKWAQLAREEMSYRRKNK